MILAGRSSKKNIDMLAHDPNAVIVFQDEVHFLVQSSVREKWAKIGSEPRVKSKPGKENVSYSGFVVHGTGQLLIYKPSWFTYETTIEMLRAFLKDIEIKDGQKIYLVMDNAPWHRKARRLINEEEQYSDIRDMITFLDIPPYSPDLNPIEQVWRVTRRESTHNRYFASKADLTEKLDAYFARFVKPNDKLRTLCTFNYNKETKKPTEHPRKAYRAS